MSVHETSSPAEHKDTVPTGSGEVGFTPGPWSLVTYHRTGHSGLIPVWYIKASNDVGIAVQPSFSCPDHEAANARLIAAAPELYEALEIAEYAMDQALDSCDEINAEGLRIACKKARAALKKARGES